MSHDIPVILITYNRPQHTARVLSGLEANGARNLHIYCDFPKSAAHIPAVEETRRLVRSVSWTTPRIVERAANLGLARSILSACDELYQQYDQLILLEDDCVPGPHFMHFMRETLSRYRDHPRVFGVSGYSIPLPPPALQSYPYDLYFFPRIGSWGWATWRRAWQTMHRDLLDVCQRCIAGGVDLVQGGTDVPHMAQSLLSGGLVDAWTLPWVFSVYLQHGYYIYPTVSHIDNIGMDGTGIHCGVTEKFRTPIAQSAAARFPSDIVLNREIYLTFRRYYDLSTAVDPMLSFNRLLAEGVAAA